MKKLKLGLEQIKQGRHDDNQVIVYFHGFNFFNREEFLEKEKEALLNANFKGAVYFFKWNACSPVTLPKTTTFLISKVISNLIKYGLKGILKLNALSWIAAALLEIAYEKRKDFIETKKRISRNYSWRVFNEIEKELGDENLNKDVIFIGHSLGTFLIYKAMRYMAKKGKKPAFNLKEIIFMGSAIDQSEFALNQDQLGLIDGNFFNFSSSNDLILKILLKGINPNIKALGCYNLKKEYPFKNVHFIETKSTHSNYYDMTFFRKLLLIRSKKEPKSQVQLYSSESLRFSQAHSSSVRFTSTPLGAKISINDVHTGITPCRVLLNKFNGSKSIKLEKEGYDPFTITLDSDFNNATLGNDLIGGNIVATKNNLHANFSESTPTKG